MSNKQQATFGSGCFWCSEAIFKSLKGVFDAIPGYAGGHTENPTYEEVCTDTTGHAEVVQVTFDPQVISYEQLVQIFFSTHDPTTLNRQGNDIGTQYRSVIFYHDDEQRAIAEKVMAEVEPLWEDPIVTEISHLTNFFPAEDYHRDYFAKHPQQAYCSAVIAPKVAKFRSQFAELLKG